MANDKLLELRKDAKKRKPTFVVKESKFCSGVKRRWRFPRGKHSKVRQMHKGRPPMPSPGYGSPKEVKGLHSSGLEMVRVCNVDDLNALNEEQGAIIAKVGKKKKIELLELALDKKVTVLNVKDLALEVEKLKKEFTERQELKKKRLVQVSKKEEEKKKKAEEKEKKDKKEKEKEEGKESVEEKLEEKKPASQEGSPSRPPSEEVKKEKSEAEEKEEKEKKAEKKEKKKTEEKTKTKEESSHSVRDVLNRTKQKEMIEKTITKRQ